MKLKAEYVQEVAERLKEHSELFGGPMSIEPEEGLDYYEEVMCEFSVVAYGRFFAYADAMDPEEGVWDKAPPKIGWDDMDIMHVEPDKKDKRLMGMDGRPFDKHAWMIEKNSDIMKQAKHQGIDIPPWFYEMHKDQTTLEKFGVTQNWERDANE